MWDFFREKAKNSVSNKTFDLLDSVRFEENQKKAVSYEKRQD